MTKIHPKPANNKIRVQLLDQMVLIGIGLALLYMVFDAALYFFLSHDGGFFDKLIRPETSDIWARIAIAGLFIIFGCYAQFTINQHSSAESALRASEEKFRSIIENAPDGYYEVDLGGNFVFFNDSMCTILGYSRQELSKMNQRQLLDESNSQKLSNTFHKVIEGGQPVKLTRWAIAGKNRSRGFVESSVFLRKDAQGNPRGFGGFIRDVTRRHRAEALYRAKLAAEVAGRSKSELMANMSHEIRAPLNSMIGLVDLMLNSDPPPNQLEDLDVVKSSAHSLLSIINNILDFSKIEAGKLVFEQTPFSLGQFMEDALKIMGMKSHEKGIELAYRIAPGVPDRLRGDPTRLRQVLVNLVDNAIKFTEKGEVIVFVATHALTDYDVILNISVVDTGIGIPKDKQRSIFGAYNQVGSAGGRTYGGTGLGLAVSAQLVALMDGWINVKSQPGKGSRFRFTARFDRQQDGESSARWIPQPDRGTSRLAGLKVLVSDDSAANRNIIKEILEDLQMNSISASSAQETKEILLQTPSNAAKFDLIILDSDMPDTDGPTLASWIIEHRLDGAGIIVLLTFPHLKHRPELETLGNITCIIKPAGAAELEAAILSLLEMDGAQTAATENIPRRPYRVPQRSLKVLVAEDTPYNQRTILRLLKHWEHQATLVENGRQALEVMQRKDFDIILMDVEMPEMDGLSATKKIRQWEARIRQAEGGRRKETSENSELKSGIRNPIAEIERVPIIAMTAHAVKGDRERCLAAGMDLYLSKPIDSDELFEAMETLTRESVGRTNLQPDATTDYQKMLLQAFDGDWNFLTEIVEVFLGDYPDLIDDLQQASAAGDRDLIMRSAHSLKGMLKNFQAESAAAVAHEIETAAKAGNFDDVDLKIDYLIDRINRVDKKLRSILAQRPVNR